MSLCTMCITKNSVMHCVLMLICSQHCTILHGGKAWNLPLQSFGKEKSTLENNLTSQLSFIIIIKLQHRCY